MEQLNERGPTPASHQQTAQPIILPAQIWMLLNPQQQQRVFQRLVAACQDLVHQPHEPEAPHEPV